MWSAKQEPAGALNLNHADGTAVGARHHPGGRTLWSSPPGRRALFSAPQNCPQLCPTCEVDQQFARLPPLAHGRLCPSAAPTHPGTPRPGEAALGVPVSLKGDQAVVTSRVGGKAGGRSLPTQSRASSHLHACPQHGPTNAKSPQKASAPTAGPPGQHGPSQVMGLTELPPTLEAPSPQRMHSIYLLGASTWPALPEPSSRKTREPISAPQAGRSVWRPGVQDIIGKSACWQKAEPLGEPGLSFQKPRALGVRGQGGRWSSGEAGKKETDTCINRSPPTVSSPRLPAGTGD